MALYPLALLPVVTVSAGEAKLPPPGYGASEGSAPFADVVAAWVDQGVHWIHVDDADAIDGSGSNLHLMVPSGAHLQYAGGIRDDAALQVALASGASRVVIETDDVEWAQRAVVGHGDRVAAAIDVRQPHALGLAEGLQQAGCGRLLVTDHAHESHWRVGDRHVLSDICHRVSIPVMARGGVRHLNDLHELHDLVPKGLDGIIIGDALYNGSFSYAEAGAAGADRFDMYYWGPPNP